MGYFEMPEDDRPDESIWLHQEKLDEWFENVKFNRKHPGQERIKDSGEDDEWDKLFTIENDYVKEWRESN